jgi:Putative Zn-dependent protease, contains TPR repeats
MPRTPLFGRPVEFQVTVSGFGVILDEQPADLDYAVVISAYTEVHGIRISFSWQMGTIRGVSQVTATAQMFVRRNGCAAWRGASAREAISEGQAAAVAPQLGVVPGNRIEIRAGHHVLTAGILRAILLAEARGIWANPVNIFAMADNSRLELLQEILAQDPNNKLARYGLAMEYSNSDQIDAALAEFQKLIAVDPTYANAYFMGAQALQKAERNDEAKALLQQGIAAAQKMGNRHAESEMQAMLDQLEIGY